METRLLKDIAYEALQEKGILNAPLNKKMLALANVLDEEIPESMRFTLANYALTTFVNHFQTKIEISEGNWVPCNAINFVLAFSGTKKTSSVNFLESAMSGGYEEIENHRKQMKKVKEETIGEKLPKLQPLFANVSTEQGLVQALNDFSEEGIGCPALFVDEIATELQTSPDIIPNMKLIAQLFDSGHAKVKFLKDRGNQLAEVHGMGMCALFIGSEHTILEDKDILKAFESEFISKLARRCFFCYPVFKMEKKRIIDYEKHSEQALLREQEANEIKNKMIRYSRAVAKAMMNWDSNAIAISDEARKVHRQYEDYCKERSKDMSNEPVILEQKERAWKVLKLAGAYAAFDKKNEIEIEHYAQAASYAERISGDLQRFLNKASRLPHEILVEHMIEKGSALSVHDLLKQKLIKKQEEIHDLISAANSTGLYEGSIKLSGTEIIGEPYQRSEEITMSIKKIPDVTTLAETFMDEHEDWTEKQCYRAAKTYISEHHTRDGYQIVKTTFDKIGGVLAKPRSFCPFEYRDGKRGDSTLVGGTNLIVLDIDDGEMDIESAAEIFGDYKYHMARTSNPNNPMKYRILLESDIIIDLKKSEYQALYQRIGELFNMTIDIVPKSQFFFGYADREVYSNMVGEKLEVSKIIQKAKELSLPVEKRATSKASIERIWKNRRKFFHYAYDLQRGGNGIHRKLHMAMWHAKNTGFTFEQNKELMQEIVASGEQPRPGFVAELDRQRKRIYSR